MRATPMSMFFSRARATASSIVRSTRGPGVRKGGVGWTAAACACGDCAGTAGVAGVVCAAAGTIADNTSAAAVTTFFFTIASNLTFGMKPSSLPVIAAAVALLAHRFRLGGHLGALLGLQHLVDAIQQQH